MRDFPECNKACAICNESINHNGMVFCSVAYYALHDNGLALVGINVVKFGGDKYVEVQPWNNCAQNCPDFSVDEERAKSLIPEDESIYADHAFDWHFRNSNHV